MSFQHKNFWMPRDAGCLAEENMGYDHSSKTEPKRDHQWFLSTGETEVFSNKKKQAIEAVGGNPISGVSQANISSWDTNSGFHSVAGQFSDRLFGSELRAVNMVDKNITISTGVDYRKNDGNISLGPIYNDGTDNSISTGTTLSKTDDNLVSMGHTFNKGDGSFMLMGQNYGKGDENMLSMSQPFDRGDGNFISMGQSYEKEDSNMISLSTSSYDKGHENFISMVPAYSKSGENFINVAASYDKGTDHMISVGPTYDKVDSNIASTVPSYDKGDSGSLPMGQHHNKGEGTTISFGGFHDDAESNPSAGIISGYDLLMGNQTLDPGLDGQKVLIDSISELPVNGNPKSNLKTDIILKNKEPKITKKAPANSFPSNVKSLLSTGIFDGVPVKYVSWSRERNLRGIIKGTGYLCSCDDCKQSKALNAYEFERHAGAKTKHPNNHIYFDNGKTIYAVVQELKNTPQEMLFDAIQNVTGSTINQKNFRIWKASYQAATRELQRIYGKDEVTIPS
ncbi:uncharacterized protein LOC113872381 isoform X3 [Abrus precatorius]|uniref:Uncharacterized protein LOC113872381 isoform X3 n=1 Tax=Abrus precatorius TaxID=3816 RepID=A0A8B8MCV9_ABRPR|nr:uncharacterized protein LOC113872381 isoform X3 [Abrus precatorius]